MTKSNRIKELLIYIFAGSSYALAFPFHGKTTLFPLIFISAAIYFSQFFKKEFNFKKVLINTLVFSWAYNVTGYYWLTYTLKTFGGLFPPFNILLWQLFSLIIAPQFYIFIGLFYFTKKKGLLEKLPVQTNALLISFVWTLIEYYTPQQFPAHFGHTWLVLAPYLKPAQLFGASIYTFFTVFIGITLYQAIIKKQKNIFNYALIILFIISNFAFGPINKIDNGDKANMRIVQANIGNDLKLKSETGIQLAVNQVVNIFKEMSSKKSDLDLDIIIWPETSYPRILMTKKKSTMPYELESLQTEKKLHYFIGTYDLAADNFDDMFEQQYNTTLLFDNFGNIKDTYHKIRLIPFGEGLPFGPFNKYFSKIIKNISFFAKGEKYTKFKFDKQSFISLICYEVLFSDYVRDYMNAQEQKPRFIMNLTNDSWYGRYSEQEQHLFLSKWRAVEFNLPVVRATNTGISSVILNTGEEQVRLGNYVQDVLDFTLETEESKITLFQRFGFLNITVLGLLLIGLSLVLRKKLV